MNGLVPMPAFTHRRALIISWMIWKILLLEPFLYAYQGSKINMPFLIVAISIMLACYHGATNHKFSTLAQTFRPVPYTHLFAKKRRQKQPKQF